MALSFAANPTPRKMPKDIRGAMELVDGLAAHKSLTLDVVTVAREVFLMSHGSVPRKEKQQKGAELATKHLVGRMQANGFNVQNVSAWLWVWMAQAPKAEAIQVLAAIEKGRKQ